MNASSIPQPAAAWMAQILCTYWEKRGGEHPEYRNAPETLSNKLETVSGLTTLLKRELIAVWETMSGMEIFTNKQHSRRLSAPRYFKKADMAAQLRNYFYLDDLHTIDEAAMQQLTTLTLSQKNTKATVSAKRTPPNPTPPAEPVTVPFSFAREASGPHAASAVFSAKRPPQFSGFGFAAASSTPLSFGHPAASAAAATSAPATTTATFADTPTFGHQKKKSPRKAHHASLTKTTTPAKAPSPQRRHHRAHASSKKKASLKRPSPTRCGVKVKLERDSLGLLEDPSIPRNEEESRLLRELIQNMGFGPNDKQELLDAIRRLKFQNQSIGSHNHALHQLSHPSPLAAFLTQSPPLTADAVMMHIISHREEMGEAKKMDQARIESERVRKEEARRRRSIIAQDREEQLRSASVQDWKNIYFPDSWILNHTQVWNWMLQYPFSTQQMVNEPLLELLKVERNSRKWYKNELPRAYFEAVICTRILSWDVQDTTKLLALLNEETKIVKTALCSLEQQTGGVPRLFLDAHDRYKATLKERHADTNEDNGDDDDVVIVVPDPSRTKTSTVAATMPLRPLATSALAPQKQAFSFLRGKHTSPRHKNTSGVNGTHRDPEVIEILD